MRTTTREWYRERIQATIGRMVTELDKEADARAWAREACLSPFHFGRLFAALTGEPPVAFVRRLRLERAAHRLQEGVPVLPVAVEAGYGSVEAFTRAFRDAYDVTPARYRGQAVSPELHAPSGVHWRPDGVVTPFAPLPLPGDPMQVETRELLPRRVAQLPHHGAYTAIGRTFGRLMAVAGPAGLMARPGARTIAVYLDDPNTTPEPELRSYAGVLLDETIPVPEGLEGGKIEGGTYAVYTHVGSYEGIGAAWNRLMAWTPEDGYRFGDAAPFEIYLNECPGVPPEELRTELHIPLVRA